MPAPLVRTLAGAHRPLMADLAFLRAVEHHGNPAMQALGLPQLVALIDRAVTLDMQFAGAYQFLATAADFSGPAYPAAMALLAQGIRACPKAWRIAFFSGFNAYYFGHDYARAAADLSLAAQSAEAPPHTAALATRLAAESGRPELGLALVETLLADTASADHADTDDVSKRAIWQERRRQLLFAIQLRELSPLVRTWADAHPDVPPTWQALRKAGLVLAQPRDPWGAPLLLTPRGIVSTHHNAHLRLAPEAVGHGHASR